MTAKKKVSSPKKTVKTTLKKIEEVKPEEKISISNDDSRVLEESLKLVQKLNSQVELVEKAKDKIKKDVSALSKRVEEHSKKPERIDSLEVIKEAIMHDFEPLISRSSPVKIKNLVLKDVGEIVERELQKFYSEINLKTKKISREVNQRLSDLEARLVDSLKSTESVRKELNNFEKKESLELLASFERKLKEQIKNNYNRVSDLSGKLDEGIAEVKSEVTKQKTRVTKLSKQIKEFEDKLKKEVGEDEISLTALETKVKSLSKDFSSLKSLVEKYENIVLGTREEISLEVEKKVENLLDKTRSELTQLTKSRKETEKLFDKRLDEILQNVKEFEKRLTNNEEKEIDNLKSSLEDQFQSKYAKFSEYLEKERINFFAKSEKKFAKDLENLKKFVFKLEKLKKNHENLLNELEKKSKNLEKDLLTRDRSLIEEALKETKEEIAAHIINNNEFLVRTSLEIKELKRETSEHVESKFVDSKYQFEQLFKEHLDSFDDELKLKESEFLDKMTLIETQKQTMIEELENYKGELNNLTNNYISKLDEELNKFKLEEQNFEKHKDQITLDLENLVHSRKVELGEEAQTLGESLKIIIADEKETFERHESSFREIFQEKVANLHEYLEYKLGQIEKKFVEKNIKKVEGYFNEEKKVLKDLQKELHLRGDLLIKQFDSLESKELDYLENLKANSDSLAEKIEVRMTNFEKQLNSRFLDIDTQFSSLKGVIIEEVEGLIKDVDKSLSKKSQELENLTAKQKFIVSEAGKRLTELNNINEFVETQVREVRDEVNDIRVQIEINAPSQSMNSLVKSMDDYERQLSSLVESLRDRGASLDHIKDILVSKGHPRVYVTMFIDHYKKLRH